MAEIEDVLIKLEDVKLTLGSRAGPIDILKGIDLKIRKGETVGIVGPSGSGKTSLLMVLAGLEQVSSGSVSLGDQALSGLTEDELASIRGERIGIVFQSFNLVPAMTALENVALPLELTGHKHAFSKANELLELVGLSHRGEHYPSQLSGGERQRVAIARALSSDPDLLLADEPTGNLDEENGRLVVDQLFRFHALTGTTLVLVTHDLDLAARCQRQIRIADGLVFSDSNSMFGGGDAE